MWFIIVETAQRIDYEIDDEALLKSHKDVIWKTTMKLLVLSVSLFLWAGVT